MTHKKEIQIKFQGDFRKRKLYAVLAGLSSIFIIISFLYLKTSFIEYEALRANNSVASNVESDKHMETPEPLRGVYMTSYTAGDKKLRSNLLKLIDDTELNAVVIDIKDYTGQVAFPITGNLIKEFGEIDNRIPDIGDFIKELHNNGVYVIGRIAVFQDPVAVLKRPDLAVRKESDGGIWIDKKGITWIDPAAEEYWQYIAFIAETSFNIGFDEINFDYIRFPSDGDMFDIKYPHSGEHHDKAEILRGFFSYLHDRLLNSNMVTSADLFGMTTTNKNDLLIGQILEKTLPYFDYISPMVYPSHYPPGFIGLPNPAGDPYAVVKYSMDKAYERASTTPLKIRPWLQDFNLGAVYNAPMVRAQINALKDAGFTSFMLWNSANKYTKDALRVLDFQD